MEEINFNYQLLETLRRLALAQEATVDSLNDIRIELERMENE